MRVFRIKNNNPEQFENVRVYAGNKNEESANAEIRNFNACQFLPGNRK